MGLLGSAPSLANPADPADFYAEVLAVAKHFFGQLDDNNFDTTPSTQIVESQLALDPRIGGFGHNHFVGNTYDPSTEIGIRPLRRHLDATSSFVVWNDLFGKMAGCYIRRGRTVDQSTGASGEWSGTAFSEVVTANPYYEPAPFTGTGTLITIPIVSWEPRNPGPYTPTGHETVICYLDTSTEDEKTIDPTDYRHYGAGFDASKTVHIYLTLIIVKPITED